MVVGMVVYFSFPGYEYSIVYTFEYQTLDSWYKLHLVMMYHITLLIHYRNGLQICSGKREVGTVT